MTCPHENRYYVGVDVEGPDGSKRKTVMHLSDSTYRKIQAAAFATDTHVGMEKGRFSGKLTDELVAEFQARYDVIYEGDEMRPIHVCGDFEDGSSIKEIPASEIKHTLNISTPTGRTPTDFDKLLSRNVRANWKAIQFPGAGGHAEPVQTARGELPRMPVLMGDAAFRAGRGIEKMQLSHGLFPHQIAAMRNVLGRYYGGSDGFVCKVDTKAQQFAFDIEADTGIRQFKMPLFGQRYGSGFPIMVDSFTNLPRMGAVTFATLKTAYEFEYQRSKIKDEKERHEAVCAQLLRPYKKRRKALRKILDEIGGALKDERNTESNAPDTV